MLWVHQCKGSASTNEQDTLHKLRVVAINISAASKLVFLHSGFNK